VLNNSYSYLFIWSGSVYHKLIEARTQRTQTHLHTITFSTKARSAERDNNKTNLWQQPVQCGILRDRRYLTNNN